MMSAYNPDHPALHAQMVPDLEPYLFLPQIETLISVWRDGWRMMPKFPVLIGDGDIRISAERASSRLILCVTRTGQITYRKIEALANNA